MDKPISSSIRGPNARASFGTVIVTDVLNCASVGNQGRGCRDEVPVGKARWVPPLDMQVIVGAVVHPAFLDISLSGQSLPDSVTKTAT